MYRECNNCCGRFHIKELFSLMKGTQQQWYTRGTLMKPYPHPAGQSSGTGCMQDACISCTALVRLAEPF